MKRIIMLLLVSVSLAFSATLQEMYDNALPAGDYDKLIELENGVIYTGGLSIDGATDGTASSIQIIGNGAILDMEGGKFYFANTEKTFDIQDLAVTNGFFHFFGQSAAPTGIVKFVTFYNPISYGVRMEYCGDNIQLERNIVAGAIDTGNMGISGTGISFGIDKDFPLDGIIENWSFEPGTMSSEYEGNFVKL